MSLLHLFNFFHVSTWLVNPAPLGIIITTVVLFQLAWQKVNKTNWQTSSLSFSFKVNWLNWLINVIIHLKSVFTVIICSRLLLAVEKKYLLFLTINNYVIKFVLYHVYELMIIPLYKFNICWFFWGITIQNKLKWIL